MTRADEQPTPTLSMSYQVAIEIRRRLLSILSQIEREAEKLLSLAKELRAQIDRIEREYGIGTPADRADIDKENKTE